MLTNIGVAEDYSPEDLRKLAVKEDAKGNVLYFPEVETGCQVVCAFNQWGLKNAAKLFICETLEDMNRLVKSCHSGEALSVEWYVISDNCIRMKYNDAAAFFKRKQPSYASMIEASFTEDKRRGWH